MRARCVITIGVQNKPGGGDGGLVRGIRRWDLVAIAINGIIGAGIFGLPSGSIVNRHLQPHRFRRVRTRRRAHHTLLRRSQQPL